MNIILQLLVFRFKILDQLSRCGDRIFPQMRAGGMGRFTQKGERHPDLAFMSIDRFTGRRLGHQ